MLVFAHHSPGFPGDLPHPSRVNDGGREGGTALIFMVDMETPKNNGGENWGKHHQKEVRSAQRRLHPAHVSPIESRNQQLSKAKSDEKRKRETRHAHALTDDRLACATVMKKAPSGRYCSRAF